MMKGLYKLAGLTLATVLTCVSFTCANAKSVKASGNRALFTEQGVALLVFDFSDTTWEKYDNFKTFSEDAYDERVQAAFNGFYKSFNDKSKGLQLSKTEQGDYVMTFTVHDLERSANFIGRGKVFVTGSIEIKDANSGDVVCSVTVKKSHGKKDYVIADAMGKSFSAIAKTITKFH